MQVSECLVHNFAVSSHHFGSAFTVSFLDRFLDVRDGFIAWQDAGNAEEAGLHYGVNAPAHSDLLRQRISIDNKEANSLFDHLLLHLAWQSIPSCCGITGRIQQEDRTRSGVFQHVNLVYELKLVAGNETGAVDEVRRADGPDSSADAKP